MSNVQTTRKKNSLNECDPIRPGSPKHDGYFHAFFMFTHFKGLAGPTEGPRTSCISLDFLIFKSIWHKDGAYKGHNIHTHTNTHKALIQETLYQNLCTLETEAFGRRGGNHWKCDSQCFLPFSHNLGWIICGPESLGDHIKRTNKNPEGNQMTATLTEIQ